MNSFREKKTLDVILPRGTCVQGISTLASLNRSPNVSPEVVVAWAGVGLALVLGIVGFFQEEIRGYWRRPKLRVEVREGGGGHLLPVGDDPERTSTLWFRLWVKNEGIVRADRAHVYVAQLLREVEGELKRVDSFLPMCLRWSHSGPSSHAYWDIPADMGRHCDLGCLIEPSKARHPDPVAEARRDGKAVFILQTEVFPTNHCEMLIPGRYVLDVLIAADNAAPGTYRVELWFDGTWPAFYEISEHVKIHCEPSARPSGF